jgi:hypothetical protein
MKQKEHIKVLDHDKAKKNNHFILKNTLNLDISFRLLYQINRRRKTNSGIYHYEQKLQYTCFDSMSYHIVHVEKRRINK